MFDRTAYRDAQYLITQPFATIDALATRSALLDPALLDRTPLAALLSDAYRALTTRIGRYPCRASRQYQLMSSPRYSKCRGVSCSHGRSQCSASRSLGLERCFGAARGLSMWAQAGPFRFPVTHPIFCSAQRPGRTGKPDHSGFTVLPQTKRGGFSTTIISRLATRLRTRCLRFTKDVAIVCEDSLPAGRPRHCRRAIAYG